MSDLKTRIGSVELSNPVMTASGTAGYGAELSAFFDLSKIGAVVCKSLAPYEWSGNKPLRMHATASGMINAIGLQGPGVQYWKDKELPDLLATGAKVVASIWGKSVEEYQEAAEMLADLGDQVVAVEVNISCPHSKGTGLFCYDPQITAEIMSKCLVANRPLWAKLSPNVGPGITEIAKACLDSGAETLVLFNTFNGLAIEPSSRKPRIGNGAGGVSGAAIHPLVVKMIYDVRQALPDAPIVAAGGARTADDVAEFALVGANATQIGTATLADPRTVGRVAKDLNKWCKKNKISKFTDLINQALPEPEMEVAH